MIQHLIDTHFHLDYYKEHQKIYDGINERKQYTLCMTNSPGVYISCKRISANKIFEICTWIPSTGCITERCGFL